MCRRYIATLVTLGRAGLVGRGQGGWLTNSSNNVCALRPPRPTLSSAQQHTPVCPRVCPALPYALHAPEPFGVWIDSQGGWFGLTAREDSQKLVPSRQRQRHSCDDGPRGCEGAESSRT